VDEGREVTRSRKGPAPGLFTVGPAGSPREPNNSLSAGHRRP